MKRADVEEGYVNVYLDGVRTGRGGLSSPRVGVAVIVGGAVKSGRGSDRRLLSFQLKKEETKVYSVILEEELPVRNLKPAVVKVYDYYQTSEHRPPPIPSHPTHPPVVMATDVRLLFFR